MSPKLTITENELVEALRDAMSAGLADPTDARTTGEMAAAIGRADKFVRDNVRKLIAEGRVELVKVKRQGIDGRMNWVPAYRIRAA